MKYEPIYYTIDKEFELRPTSSMRLIFNFSLFSFALLAMIVRHSSIFACIIQHIHIHVLEVRDGLFIALYV